MANRVYNVLWWIIMGAFVTVILGFVVMAAGFKMVPYVVVSGSMEPEIKTGSVCFVNCHEKTPDIGEVVTYKAGESLITHRVIEIKDNGYITKGDNNEAADPGLVYPGRIVGTEAFAIPYAGYALMYMKTWRGFALLVMAAVTFIAIGRLTGKTAVS